MIENGTNVLQYPAHDKANQSWLFIPYNPEQPISDGRYVIHSALGDGLKLAVEGSDGTVNTEANVQLGDSSVLNENNLFDVSKLENGYYEITHASSGLALDVYGGGSENGSNISLFTPNGSLAQQWTITKVGTNFVIKARCSGYALDVYDNGTANGTNVTQYYYKCGDNNSNQLWTFDFPKEQLSASNITVYSASVEYNGKVRTPAITVKNAAGVKLTEGTDYTVTVPTGRQYPGTYVYKITGKGNYTGTVSKNFVIKPYTVKADDITLYSQTVEYNGKVRTPKITVKTSWGATLTEGTHYTVSIPEGRQYPGTYKYTFTFKGRFAGTVTKDFVIKPYTVKESDITLYSQTVTYNGKVRTPSITVKTPWGATLTEGTHYTVVIPAGRKDPGAYTYTFTFKGRFTGTVNKTFTILAAA